MNEATKDPLLLELERDLAEMEQDVVEDKKGTEQMAAILDGVDLKDTEMGAPPSEELSFHEIYKKLTLHGELILVIDKEEEGKLRKGLSAVKAKHISKLREANISQPPQVIEFIPHPPSGELPAGVMKIQVVLKDAHNSVKVHSVIIPDTEI